MRPARLPIRSDTFRIDRRSVPGMAALEVRVCAQLPVARRVLGGALMAPVAIARAILAM